VIIIGINEIRRALLVPCAAAIKRFRKFKSWSAKCTPCSFPVSQRWRIELRYRTTLQRVN